MNSPTETGAHVAKNPPRVQSIVDELLDMRAKMSEIAADVARQDPADLSE